MTLVLGPRGMDLSLCNSDPDFAAIKAAGIEFVYHRATCGTAPDSAFQRRRAAARQVGLRWGSYGVLKPGDNALAQAAAFIAAVGALEATDLPSFIDLESAGDKPDDAEAWCCHVDEAFERETGVYSYGPFLVSLKLPADHPLHKRWLWLADYEVTPHSPPGWRQPTLWQAFGDVGVPAVAIAFGPTGINGAHLDGGGVHIDRDYFNGSLSELVAWIASTSLAQMPPVLAQASGPVSPLRVETDDQGIPTPAATPSAKSSQRMAAVRAEIVDDAPTTQRSAVTSFDGET